MTPAENFTAQLLSKPVYGSAQPVSSDGMPTNQALDRPVIVNDIWIEVAKARSQSSPIFEVRGCDLEGNGLHYNVFWFQV